MLRKRLQELRLFIQNQKIERFAYLISNVQITGDFPDDITYREFEEIAVWDSISRRVAEIVEQAENEAGVTGIIDSSQALRPRSEDV